jgi:hypothetical protein
MKETKFIVNTFESRIKLAVSNKAKLNTLLMKIQSYFDKNSLIIYDTAPSKKLFFTDSEKEIVYSFTEIPVDEVSKVLRHDVKIDASWKLINDPFVVQSVLIIRELTIRKLISERDFVIMFLSMKFYSSRQARSFKYGANENIMNYTINNLSDKFKYKTLKNNYNVIKDVSLNSHATYESLLVQGNDSMFLTYIPQMENRIGKVLINIAELYYDNYEKKNYLNFDRSFDEENDRMVEGETSSSLVIQLAEGTTHDFISKKINMGLVKLACSKNEVSFATLFSTLQSIKSNETADFVKTLLLNIVTNIFNNDNSILERVCSTEFVVYSLKQLSISNTSSPELIAIKNDLEYLLNKHCSKYVNTNRAATKANYRSAVYAYFVYSIIVFKCH